MSALPLVSNATFDREVLQKPGVHLVDFTGQWCGPCRALAPVLVELSRTLAGQVSFVEVDTDQEPELGERFQIRAMPTLLIIRDGRVVDQLVGAAPRSTIEARLRRAMA